MEITQKVKDFLTFDLGELDLSLYSSVKLDIPYMENGKQTLDLYYPDGEGPFPLIIVVHGGGWISGYKRSKFMGPMIKPIEHGFAVACISYTLAMEKPFPQAIYDIKTAIRFFKANGSSLNCLSNQMFLWGESAGAHLVSLTGCTLEDESLVDRQAGWANENHHVQGVISHYGVYDFLSVDHQLAASGFPVDWPMTDEDSMASWFVGQPILLDLDKTKQCNPMSYVHQCQIPFYLRHGLKDSLVPWQQTEQFASALQKQGSRVDVAYLEEAVHTDIAFFTDQEIQKIVDFCKQVLA